MRASISSSSSSSSSTFCLVGGAEAGAFSSSNLPLAMLVDSAGAPVAEESAIVAVVELLLEVSCRGEQSGAGRKKFVGDQSEGRPNPNGTDGLGSARANNYAAVGKKNPM
jgi:hypothetical protein